MAAGPQLIGIQPNNSDLIENGVVRDVAPRELTFRFDQNQIIDASTTAGIRLSRSGFDGTFGLNSVSTDFGTSGKVDIQLTMKSAGQSLNVTVLKADLGNQSQAPLLSLDTAANPNRLTITLNSNATTPTTAVQLVNAINSSSTLFGVLGASINGGFADAKLGTLTPSNFGSLSINSSNDVRIVPASVVVGNAPNQNEVTLRFGETLVDDAYRIEIFGFDDANSGIVGLRSSSTVTAQQGNLFVPKVANTNQDTVFFRLDLGSKVLGVVPQPVIRNSSDGLEQLNNQIIVYFDNDKLLVENNAQGLPTSRSAENTDFYQLIYTSDTVRNTDDSTYKASRATYNATANSVTLEFFTYTGVPISGVVSPGSLIPASQLNSVPAARRVALDINTLRPVGGDNAAFRLRIGTRESIPFAPTKVETSATAITDLNTDGAARIKFTSKFKVKSPRT